MEIEAIEAGVNGSYTAVSRQQNSIQQRLKKKKKKEMSYQGMKRHKNVNADCK